MLNLQDLNNVKGKKKERHSDGRRQEQTANKDLVLNFLKESKQLMSMMNAGQDTQVSSYFGMKWKCIFCARKFGGLLIPKKKNQIKYTLFNIVIYLQTANTFATPVKNAPVSTPNTPKLSPGYLQGSTAGGSNNDGTYIW